MGALLKLMGREKTALSPVTAPSLGLIEADVLPKPKIPEPVEIECELSPEQLETYLQTINHTKYQNRKLQMECLKHFLKRNGYKRYTNESINKLMCDISSCLKRKTGKNHKVYLSGCDYEECNYFVSPRIINQILSIKEGFSNSENLKFTVINFNSYCDSWNGYTYHILYGIFLLKLGSQLENIIIDALRDPTFSDEEAKI